MRGAHQATTAVTTVIPAGTGWTIAHFANVSDTTIYIQWSEESTALTTANGMPIAAGAMRSIIASDVPVRAAVQAIHGGSGNKELRYVAE